MHVFCFILRWFQNLIKRKPKFFIIAARYKEDIRWMKHLVDDYCVYNHDDKHLLSTPNKGNEAASYLKFIIDNYEHFPARNIIFIHAHEFSWHHDGSHLTLLNNKSWLKEYNGTFLNINNFLLTGECSEIDQMTPWWNENMKPWFGTFSTYGKLPWSDGKLKGAAQFVINEKYIRRNPKSFYVNMYNWIISTDVETYWTGRYLEWTWHIIFGKPCVVR
tara:strand:- start:3107 stop:3760 length:654 start_codon:yes stop_codon:yes gene_type:complete